MPRHEIVRPSPRQTASSPRVDDAWKGLHLAGPAEISTRERAVVSGAFQLLQEDARRIDEQPHRGLVLVLMTQSCAWTAITPFRDFILFDDDVEILAGYARGYFSIPVLDGSERELFAGEVHVHASLGELMADPITIKVR